MPAITVVARIRPMADQIGLTERLRGTDTETLKLPSLSSGPSSAPASSVSVSANTLTVRTPASTSSASSSFSYLSSTIQGSDQDATYNTLGAPILSHLANNKNSTVLAYGQTGSGKTHTMFGPEGALTNDAVKVAHPNVPQSWGIFPRAAFFLLSDPAVSSLSISAIEVFQEKTYDLLNSRRPLQMGTETAAVYAPNERVASLHGAEASNGTHPPGCRCGVCWQAKKKAQEERMARRDSAQAAQTKRAPSKRAAAPTEDNFRLIGETVEVVGTPQDIARVASTVEATRIALSHNLNDRSSRSHAMITLHLAKHDASGRELKQLLLGMVIQGLAMKKQHIPYRDSKLTKLLRGQLEGGAKITICVCVADGAEHAEESVCTMRFGSRCAAVSNVAHEQSYGEGGGDPEEALNRCRAELAELEEKGFGETFGQGFPESEVNGYKRNVATLSESKERQLTFQRDLMEAKARAKRMGGGESRGSKKIASKVGELAAKVAECKRDVENYEGLVMRQRSIKGFVRAPNKLYAKKLGELKELEQRVTRRGGGGVKGSASAPLL
ncbi:hypothetical protein TeGR_g9221 [Tetraparma gracilis]|uniref:Kinesin motor domain-containing protein n=1 Tax=Tetraparma gracilis TaxID=2962635 RepID=A0ABQ6MMY7_9STRA|nr:hypothetical protein TeGR_g9221 [Tetraparma gracilis]